LTSNYSCVRIRARSSNEFSSWKKTQTLFPEVLAISLKDDQIIVIVDQAKAKLYLRINSLVEAVNKKLYFGAPVKAAVRDDLSIEDLQRILREPGIVYIREDIVLKPEPKQEPK